ncbi:MAG: hypothetical protein L0H41_17670 [Microlunatus sp.]|nr:hypothetical protein [Microlunatus sp.]
MTTPIPAPWVLVDADTVTNTMLLLQRLTGWLEGGDTAAAQRCAAALSLGETHDPITIADWTDGLALELEHRTAAGTIDTELNH